MQLSELTDDALDFIFSHIDPANLSKSDLAFVESVQDRWDRERWLSDKQKMVVGNIWDRQP